MINCHFSYRMCAPNFGWRLFWTKMKKRLDIHKSIYVSAFLIFTGLLSLQVHADGIASVNSYVEIKSDATDLRSRKQSSNGQRSTSGFDFIITPERTNICQQGHKLRALNGRSLLPAALFGNPCFIVQFQNDYCNSFNTNEQQQLLLHSYYYY